MMGYSHPSKGLVRLFASDCLTDEGCVFQRGLVPVSLLQPADLKASKGKKKNVKCSLLAMKCSFHGNTHQQADFMAVF